MNHTTTETPSPLPSIFPFIPSGQNQLGDIVVMDLAIIMLVAAVMIAVAFKLKQPMVMGYIFAGMIIGPYTPPFTLVSSLDTINLLAELGIIMLLFVVGTEFPVAKLRAVGRISLVVALAEALGTLTIVFFIAQHLGFSFFDSMFLSLAMSITSTVVTVRVLEELGLIQDKSSLLLLGISIVEDILAISILAILQSVAAAGGDNFSIVNIAISIGLVGAFIGSILVIGSKYMPPIIDRVGRTNDYTLLLIVILALAFGLSFVAQGLGLSVATGAFLAGVLVAESKSASVAKIVTIPLRDMFAAIFFISIGALMDISLIPLFIIPAVILILASFASKFLIVTSILAKAKIDNTTALRTGLGMASAKGELSLVVVKGGQDVGAITNSILPILGVVTIITTFITPFIIRLGAKLNLSEATEEGGSTSQT
ncbi:MAG: cation:proton antiporter, partial [Thermoproteota archaeon]|nr:cation:proton antiporter [Thermoproteota archaeon]